MDSYEVLILILLADQVNIRGNIETAGYKRSKAIYNNIGVQRLMTKTFCSFLHSSNTHIISNL